MSKSEHEGTEAWRQGIKDSIAWVKYRQMVMPDLQKEAYKAALSDVMIHLQAMLERGTASAISICDGDRLPTAFL